MYGISLCIWGGRFSVELEKFSKLCVNQKCIKWTNPLNERKKIETISEHFQILYTHKHFTFYFHFLFLQSVLIHNCTQNTQTWVRWRRRWWRWRQQKNSTSIRLNILSDFSCFSFLLPKKRFPSVYKLHAQHIHTRTQPKTGAKLLIKRNATKCILY